MKIWDISRPLTGTIAPWPGDTPFDYKLNARIPAGSSVNLGRISMSVHNGTHADAPFHFDDAGNTIEQMPLAAYFGRAHVVDLTGRLSESGRQLIETADLEPEAKSIAETRRLLLKTGAWPDSSVFPSWIPVLAPGVTEWLGQHGVCLVGFDVPSVDPITAKVLSNHQALARAGACIIESLDLSTVSAGTYNFAALPLRITGADGAPVRAILWRDD